MYKKINNLGIISLVIMILARFNYVVLIKYLPAKQITFFIEPLLALIIFILWLLIYREFDKIFNTQTTRLYIYSISSWLLFSAVVALFGGYLITSKSHQHALNMTLMRAIAVALYVVITIVLTTIQYKFANQFMRMYLQTNSPWLKFFAIAYKIAAILLFAIVGYPIFIFIHFIFNVYVIFIGKFEPIKNNLNK